MTGAAPEGDLPPATLVTVSYAAEPAAAPEAPREDEGKGNGNEGGGNGDEGGGNGNEGNQGRGNDDKKDDDD